MNILLVFFIFSIVPVIGVYRVAGRRGRAAGTWAILTAISIVLVYAAAFLYIGFSAAFLNPDKISRPAEALMGLVLYSSGAALVLSILINIAALYMASRPRQNDRSEGEVPPPPDFGDNS